MAQQKERLQVWPQLMDRVHEEYGLLHQWSGRCFTD